MLFRLETNLLIYQFGVKKNEQKTGIVINLDLSIQKRANLEY